MDSLTTLSPPLRGSSRNTCTSESLQLLPYDRKEDAASASGATGGASTDITQRKRCALALAQPDSTTEPPSSKKVSVASLWKLSRPVNSIPCSIRCTPRTSGGVGEVAGVENWMKASLVALK